MMKLAPMKPLDNNATMTPLRLSLEITMSKNRHFFPVLNLFLLFIDKLQKKQIFRSPLLNLWLCCLFLWWKLVKATVRMSTAVFYDHLYGLHLLLAKLIWSNMAKVKFWILYVTVDQKHPSKERCKMGLGPTGLSVGQTSFFLSVLIHGLKRIICVGASLSMGLPFFFHKSFL